MGNLCNEIQTILGAKPPKVNIANNIKKWYHIVHKQYPTLPPPSPEKKTSGWIFKIEVKIMLLVTKKVHHLEGYWQAKQVPN